MSGIFRLPLIPIFFAYALGIYIGHLDPPLSSAAWIIATLALVALWALLVVLKRRIAATVFAIALFFVLGISSIDPYIHPSFSPHHVSRFIGLDGIVVEGTLYRPPEESYGRTQLRVRAQKVIHANQTFAAEGRLLIFWKGSRPPLHMGDRLRFRCKLHRPHGSHNPGGFSYEHYLSFERIYTIGFLNEEAVWVKVGEGSQYSPLHIIERLRSHIRNFLTNESQPLSSGIFKALVLGERGDIPEEIKEQFTVAGIAHLLAISGDHLGIIALLSFSLFLWILKRSEFLLLTLSVKKWAAGLTLPFILLYTFIAGAGISVIRATIMVTTFFLSILFGRERNLLHTLVLAAFLILLFSPPSLFDVSFQLSFLAVLSILYLVPRLFRMGNREEILPTQETPPGRRFWSYLKISLSVSSVAILGTAPFVALHFNRISLIGFLTNLFFVPWVGFFIVPLSLAASLLSFFVYPLALLLIQINDWATVLLLRAVALSASFPYASFYVSTPTAFEIFVFYLLLFATVHLRRGKSVKYLFLGCFVALLLNFAYWNTKSWFQKNLMITFIDVGNGDSILIEFPGGKRMLMDGGGLHEDRFDIGKHVIAPFLWKKKIRKIDVLALTHPDPDHFKGLNFIASHFSIGQFWDNGVRGYSESYRRLEETLLKKKIKRFSLNDQTLLQAVDGVQLSVLNPPLMKVYPRAAQNPSLLNNTSLVLKIQFGKVTVLLPGDIEQEAEYRIMRKGSPIQADILKIPHHGSASSSTQAFLHRVSPSVAILSVGERGPGRLPHPEVLRRYERLGARIFRTDQQGAITVITDGEKVEIDTAQKGNDHLTYRPGCNKVNQDSSLDK
ncbi:MAG: DNA internalization-related competence protein ComEC/Rec2 [Thermodesulfobacteriota bacterium]